ncbi:hypothetical protein V6N12_057213 [Hibiscus sabdariffa]|uniref:DUF4283 domain-containing protein n=1 Tax=Hibiscus sabdariffa TaxID=183260 RepID=A0ABR1ZJE1_9ROSI
MLRLKAKHHVLTFGHVFLISCLVLFYKRAAIFFRASTGSTVTVWAPTDSKQSISTILFSYPSARRPSFLSYVHGPEYFYSWHTLSAWLYMQFTEAESGSVVMEISCDEEDSGHWLVGSVITNKAVHGDSICHIFRSVWKSKTVSEIRELRPNLFLIKSVNEEAKNMILKWRPWVVHKDLFSIELYNPAWRATNFNFNNMAIGVDHRVEGGNLGEFLRIRVALDITKPLRQCVLLGNGQGRKPSLLQQPTAGSRRKQGIKYFDQGSEFVSPEMSNAEAEAPSVETKLLRMSLRNRMTTLLAMLPQYRVVRISWSIMFLLCRPRLLRTALSWLIHWPLFLLPVLLKGPFKIPKLRLKLG